MRVPGSIAPALAALTLAGALLACASPAASPTAPNGPPAGTALEPLTSTPAALARGPSDLRRRVVRAAEAAIGAPYRYGGTTPRGFDCSGLVHHAYASAGVGPLPRDSRGLYARSEKIRLAELEPGDLLFFTFGGARVAHVAIYVGGDAFVHAPKSGGRVERVPFDHPYWARQIRLAGRLLDR